MGNKVYQIMYVKHVSCREYARNGGLEVFIYRRALGSIILLCAGHPGQLIFRDQAHGKDQGVTRIFLLSSRDRLQPVIHLRNDDTLETVHAADLRYGMA